MSSCLFLGGMGSLLDASSNGSRHWGCGNKYQGFSPALSGTLFCKPLHPQQESSQPTEELPLQTWGLKHPLHVGCVGTTSLWLEQLESRCFEQGLVTCQPCFWPGDGDHYASHLLSHGPFPTAPERAGKKAQGYRLLSHSWPCPSIQSSVQGLRC